MKTIPIKVPILMYHNVISIQEAIKTSRKGLVVSLYQFFLQMMCLRTLGYKTITFPNLVKAIKKEASIPKNSIIVTFDDGYEGIYRYALPVLKRFHFTATIFLVAEDFSGITPSSQRAFPILTGLQVKELMQNGLSLGSHSFTHSLLTQLNEDQVFHEILDSKTALEKNFQTSIYSFAYPFGKYNELIYSNVRSSGYICALSTNFGRTHDEEDIYFLSRIPVGLEQNLPEFLLRFFYIHEEKNP
jgi:peptidoglycan/xylan/chitin deacetylase (PgdA/CDA1 family)